MRPREESRSAQQAETGYFLNRFVRRGPFVATAIVRERGLWHAVIVGRRYAGATDWVHAPHVADIWHYGRRVSFDIYQKHLADDRARGVDPWRVTNLADEKPLF